MMVQLKSSISISSAMQYLKGGSSKILREEFPELEEFLWEDSFWGDEYFAETVGQRNESAIRNYIQNQ